MIKRILFAGTLSLVLFSCKDKDKGCTLTKDSFVGKYKTTSLKYKATASSPEVDYYNFFFPNVCDRDDYIEFKADGTYQLVDAGDVCVPSNNTIGTWSLSGNTLTIDAATSTVENFSCDGVTFRQSNALVTGDVVISQAVRL